MENEQGEAITNEFLFKKIEEEDIGNIWFQQDGAICHTAEATLDVLRPVFKYHIISIHTHIQHTTLLEGKPFLRNKHQIAFFEVKCKFFGRKGYTISVCELCSVRCMRVYVHVHKHFNRNKESCSRCSECVCVLNPGHSVQYI